MRGAAGGRQPAATIPPWYMDEITERTIVAGVCIRTRNGAPSRKGCVVNDQMAKASNK